MTIKAWTVALMTLALYFPLAARADLIENWCTTYVSQGPSGLHRITIDKVNGEVKIHATAYGFPDDIDWGESIADVYSDQSGRLPRFIAHFSVGKAKSMLVFAPNGGGGSPHSGGVANCALYTKYTDGRPQQYIEQGFGTERKP